MPGDPSADQKKAAAPFAKLSDALPSSRWRSAPMWKIDPAGRACGSARDGNSELGELDRQLRLAEPRTQRSEHPSVSSGLKLRPGGLKLGVPGS